MRGDENKNIDVPSKVKAFRKDFPPDTAAISTSFEVVELAGAPAVVGHAVVTATARTDAFTPGAVLAEAYATRGLRAPIAGAQGMKDTRDAERAMTGAVGRALFLMGYGEKPDDSVDYEPEDWFKANGWESQEQHDAFREDFRSRLKATDSTDAAMLWRSVTWPVSSHAAAVLADSMRDLEAKARA